MSQRFTQTHLILSAIKGQAVIPVMFYATANHTEEGCGALYTEQEWESYDNADWELVDGELRFQGQVSDKVLLPVSGEV